MYDICVWNCLDCRFMKTAEWAQSSVALIQVQSVFGRWYLVVSDVALVLAGACSIQIWTTLNYLLDLKQVFNQMNSKTSTDTAVFKVTAQPYGRAALWPLFAFGMNWHILRRGAYRPPSPLVHPPVRRERFNTAQR